MINAPVLFGVGGYVPDAVLDNEALSRIVETSDEWITTRTGIRERRILAPGSGGACMAAVAARRAIEDAGIPPESITHILYATCTPDAMCPPTSCTLADKLGLSGVFTADVNVACSGYIYGLTLTRGLLAAEPEATVLLVAADVMSSRVNWQDRSTCVLFGDAAGAAVFRAGGKGKGILKDALVSSNGALGPLLHVGGGGSATEFKPGDVIGPEFFIRMEGREVYKHAVRCMVKCSRDILERNGLGIEDVDLFIPHQANLRIIEAVGSKLGFPAEKVFCNVQIRGNTSAASIPLAFYEAREAGLIRPGMTVLFATFGGGFTWGSALLQL